MTVGERANDKESGQVVQLVPSAHEVPATEQLNKPRHTGLRKLGRWLVIGLVVAGAGQKVADFEAKRFGRESATAAANVLGHKAADEAVKTFQEKLQSQSSQNFIHDQVNNQIQAAQPQTNQSAREAAKAWVEELEVEFQVDYNHDGYIGPPPEPTVKLYIPKHVPGSNIVHF